MRGEKDGEVIRRQVRRGRREFEGGEIRNMRMRSKRKEGRRRRKEDEKRGREGGNE